MQPYVCEYFGSFIKSCSKTQEVTLELFERFDNNDFGTQSLDLEVSNDLLQFKKATLQVNTQLFGMRYLMHHWFWTTAAIVIIGFSLFFTTCILLVILCIKKYYNLTWL